MGFEPSTSRSVCTNNTFIRSEDQNSIFPGNIFVQYKIIKYSYIAINSQDRTSIGQNFITFFQLIFFWIISVFDD